MTRFLRGGGRPVNSAATLRRWAPEAAQAGIQLLIAQAS